MFYGTVLGSVWCKFNNFTLVTNIVKFLNTLLNRLHIILVYGNAGLES